jgi:hypothetical protein
MWVSQIHTGGEVMDGGTCRAHGISYNDGEIDVVVNQTAKNTKNRIRVEDRVQCDRGLNSAR